MKSKRFFVTTPIFYLNGSPHLGHYYATTIADILSRYYAATPRGSFFLTGTDEHGQKVAEKAQSMGLSPQEYTDQLAQEWKDVWKQLDIEYSHFVRTTDESHTSFAQEVIQRLKSRGAIYKQEYEALYCVGAESFVTQSELREGGLCPDHDEKPRIIHESNWFFRLTAYTDEIIDLIERDIIEIYPKSRKNESLEMLRGESAISDFSVTRQRVQWGIPVPFDEEQTLYVWIDALFNYMSAIIHCYSIPFQERSIEDIIQDMAEVWPPDVQIIGKDILKFHTIYWPAFLLALGVPVSGLPKKLVVTGMFVSNGRKMSKSLGNVVIPENIVDFFDQVIGETRGNDVLRYFIVQEMMIGNDGDVSLERIQEVYQSDLVNKIGNTYQRVLGMAKKYGLFEKRLPTAKKSKLQSTIQSKCQEYMNQQDLYGYVHYILDLLTEISRGIETVKPWELVKDQARKTDLEFYLSQWLTVLDIVSDLLEPVMPRSSQKMKNILEGEEGMLFPRIS